MSKRTLLTAMATMTAWADDPFDAVLFDSVGESPPDDGLNPNPLIVSPREFDEIAIAAARCGWIRAATWIARPPWRGGRMDPIWPGLR